MRPTDPAGPAIRHDYIDTLRGLAFLGVLAVHVTRCVEDSHKVSSFPGSELGHIGRFGVQLFFMTSAMTLFMSLAERRQQEHFPIRNFFVRRLFRIGPLFWCAIPFYLWFHGVGPSFWAPHGLSGWQVAATALFLHGWHPESISSVVPGGWSIAAEMSFYLLVPFLASRLRTLRAAFLGLGASLVISVGASMALNVPFLGRVFPGVPLELLAIARHYLLPIQLPIFMLGILTYFLSRSPDALVFLRTNGRAQFLLSLVPLALGTLAYSRINDAPFAVVPLAFGVVFVGLILGLAAYPVKFLVNRCLNRLGELSFSCYIVHFALLTMAARYINVNRFSRLPENLQPGIHFICLGGVALILTWMVSTLTYLLIETPGIRTGRRLITRWEPPFAKTPARSNTLIR